MISMNFIFKSWCTQRARINYIFTASLHDYNDYITWQRVEKVSEEYATSFITHKTKI
jgi:hypothetical protein